MDADDPRTVRSIAVTTDDVVSAYETALRGTRTVVLRVTPPFSGRMRARLHTVQDETADTDAIHLDPRDLVDGDAAGPLPTPDDTEDAIRDDPDETYTRERHRERHAEAVAAWRERVADAVVDECAIPAPDGPHTVAIKRLG